MRERGVGAIKEKPPLRERGVGGIKEKPPLRERGGGGIKYYKSLSHKNSYSIIALLAATFKDDTEGEMAI